MLELPLRQGFSGKRLKGTAIELANEASTGATQVAAYEFLRITYPALDLLKAVEAVGPGLGRPIVVIGERGLGKSHLLAVGEHSSLFDLLEVPQRGGNLDAGRCLDKLAVSWTRGRLFAFILIYAEIANV
jgi:hypothetical protein